MHPCRTVTLITLALVKCHALTPKRVLVVGGSGRVGASTVRWIEKLAKAEQVPVELAIGGRRQASFDAAAKRLGAKGVDDIKFVRLDLDDAASLETAVAGRSLVVHTAGPFQQRTDPTLLKACIDAGVPYCDVCDELELSRAAKKLTSDVPAVISCGIWPGASALLAARVVRSSQGVRDRPGADRSPDEAELLLGVRASPWAEQHGSRLRHRCTSSAHSSWAARSMSGSCTRTKLAAAASGT